MDGYNEALGIDIQIGKLLEEFPITPENVMEWMNFHRTIKSILNILEAVIKGNMK